MIRLREKHFASEWPAQWLGFNSDAGVTSWDGTPTGMEQLALGRRHNVLPLDESRVIDADENKIAEFMRLLAYRLAKNRQKHRGQICTPIHRRE